MNDLYIISTLSNMHVGSGNVSFGVIDNLIQRDVISNHPNINASGLKGALREFFNHYYPIRNEKNIEDEKKRERFITCIFGSSPKEKEELKSGAFRFFDANLLSMPIRSNKTSYLMATCSDIINDILGKIDDFAVADIDEIKKVLSNLQNKIPEKNVWVFDEKFNNCVLEDFDFNFTTIDKSIEFKDCLPLLEKLFGTPLVLLNNNDFQTICSDDYLPVIARNNLEDGKSQNLWYEQVLPRLSRLYCIIMKDTADSADITFFDSKLNENIIQIGANASIGYGFCKMRLLSNLLKINNHEN
jgi:CRISPR-associated protein Cmr4